ncbi:MAG: hypothetical protein ACFFDF_07200 [Candidatus Odinarchaeota archaeon]
MNSNSKPEEKPKVKEITNLNMKRRYQKSLAILIVGIILLIIGAIILSMFLWILVQIPIDSLFWEGGLIFFSMMCYITIGTILMIIGLILVRKSLKMRREKIE